MIAFLDENNFVYVNKDNDIIKVSLQQNGQFVQSGIIKTNYDKPLYIQKIELNENEIICYVAGSMNYQEQKTFKLCFDTI